MSTENPKAVAVRPSLLRNWLSLSGLVIVSGSLFSIVFLFLLELESSRNDPTLRHSLGVIWRGALGWVFFAGVVVVGVLVPLALVVAGYAVTIGQAGLLVAGITSLAGDLAYKYCVNTAGTYVPLVRIR